MGGGVLGAQEMDVIKVVKYGKAYVATVPKPAMVAIRDKKKSWKKMLILTYEGEKVIGKLDYIDLS